MLWGLRFAKLFYCQFLKINESELRWQRSLWWTPRGQQFNRFQGELIIHLAHIIFESHRDHQITHFTAILRDFPCNSALPLLSSLPTLLFAYQKRSKKASLRPPGWTTTASLFATSTTTTSWVVPFGRGTASTTTRAAVFGRRAGPRHGAKWGLADMDVGDRLKKK